MATDALKRLEEALSRLPERAEPLQLARARLLVGTGRADGAVAGLEEYVGSEAGRQSMAAHLGLIELLMGQNEYARASEWLDKATKIQSDHPGVVRAGMVLLGQQKKFEEIVKIASSYRENKSADPKVLLTAAAMLASAGSGDLRKLSLEISEEVMRDWPGRVDAQLAVATVSLQMGDFDRAETMYRRILEASPRNGPVLNNLANILSEVRGEQLEALRFVERGVEVEPENVHLLDTYGMILLNMPTRLADARAALEKCVSLTPAGHPTRAKAELRLALVHARQGDLANAEALMDEATRVGEQSGVFGGKERAIIEEIKRLVSSGK
jgi:tetratricopeptide (TPR) repeat protein